MVATPSTTIRAQIVDGTSQLLGSSIIVASAPGDLLGPDVDGNGDEFIVAWEKPTGSILGTHTIAVRHLEWDGSALVAPVEEKVVAGSVAVDVAMPRLAWAAGKSWLQFAERVSGSTRILLRGLATVNCATCESGLELYQLSAAAPDGNAIVAVQDAGLTGTDRFLALWSDPFFPSNQFIFGEVFDSFGTAGGGSSLGGGCGTGGIAAVGGNEKVAAGNPQLTVTLKGADPNATIAFLNINTPVAPLPCGPCLITPYFILLAQPVSGGVAQQDLAIPCKPNWVGARLELQWTVSTPGVFSGCVNDFSYSNRLHLSFGQ